MSSARVWLITGANSGLGLQLALYALSKGDKVIAAARDASKIPVSLEAAHAFELNPSGPVEEIKAATEKAASVYGRIDVLVNMAGYALSGHIETLRDDDIRTQFQTNVFGPIAIIRAVLPTMRTQKSGHIFNVSSIAGFDGMSPFGAYNASKAALDAFTDTLSMEVAPFGIRVHTIVPGYFPTNFLSTAKSTLSPSGSGSEYETPLARLDTMHSIHVERKQVGDPVKLSARIWEFVNGEGLAKDVAPSSGGKREWVRLPLGPDAGTRMRKRVEVLKETLDAYEPLWSSTDMDEERLKEFS